MEQKCIAIKTTGIKCGRICKDGNVRCSMHLNTLNNNGRHTTEIKELTNIQKKEYADKARQFDDDMLAETDTRKRNDIWRQKVYELKVLKLTHQAKLENLQVTQQREVQDTGVDPDKEANERRAEANRNRYALHVQELQQQALEVRNMRHIMFHQMLNQRRVIREAGLDDDDVDIEEQRVLINAVGAGAGLPQVKNDELAQFSSDKQNIHRERTVDLTKEMVGKILAIEVPKEYRWNMANLSKTIADIVSQCNLTPRAGWQMMSKYCQDESIYDMQNGIYGLVLDGVWQFILKSEHKDDLCKALRQEMEDNIGMCAQGNLSRLCNILSGYMDGIGPQESVSEVLGRTLPKLMDIEDIEERLTKARQILTENKVSVSEWETWLEPLVSDQEEDYSVVDTLQKWLKVDA